MWDQVLESAYTADDFLSEINFGYEQFGWRCLYLFVVAAALQPSPQILLVGGTHSFINVEILQLLNYFFKKQNENIML